MNGIMRAVFSLAYLRHVGPTSLQYRIPFDVGPKSFDVAISSTYTMPSYYALNFAWGEPWRASYLIIFGASRSKPHTNHDYIYVHVYVHVCIYVVIHRPRVVTHAHALCVPLLCY